MAEDMVTNTEPLAGDGARAELDDPSSPKAFLDRARVCRDKKRELIRDWETNVDYRRAKIAELDSDDNRFPVPIDWAMTKAKISQLFSQIPTIVVNGRGFFKQAAPSFEEQLNYRLKKGGIGATMFENLPDLVNAAGFCAAIVTYESTEIETMVPRIPDEDLSMIDRLAYASGLKEREMVPQVQAVDRKFSVLRLSPADLVWDVDFVGSDFNQSGWIGREGRMTWAEGLSNGWVTEEDRDKVLGDKRTILDKINKNDDSEDSSRTNSDDVINFTEIFYWRYLYHPEEKYYKAIHHLVFVDGKGETPVVDEPWKGQQFHEGTGKYVGACKFPIQVCTLNYLTDEAIPPSDTAMGRYQVKELNKSREQIVEQRDHSKPIRWADTNRIDSDILTAIMQGDWQGIVPTQGDGSKAIGEVARSNYPRENFEFDRVIKQDLMETWSTGPNQMGALASGERTAQEARFAQGAFDTRIGQERARVVEYFLNIADVMAGLICLFDDEYLLPPVDVQGQQAPPSWDRKAISHELVFELRGDATVLLTAEQRLDRALRLLNIGGKSGMLNVPELFSEIVSLSGFDPRTLVVTPKPQGPEPPNISFRFSGSQDLVNPIALALLLKNEQAPTPDQVAAAIKMIRETAKEAPEEMLTSVAPEKRVPADEAEGVDDPNTLKDRKPGWQMADRINTRRDSGQE